MDVNNLKSIFKKIAPQIVAGNGSKATNVQRSSNSNKGDAFVGRDISGRVLALRSGSQETIPIHRASEVIGKTFKDFAKNLAV